MRAQRIIAVFTALVCACAVAYAQTPQTRAQLEAYISTHVLDNNVGAITPAILRTALLNQAASTQSLSDLYAGNSYFCNPSLFSAAPQSCTIPSGGGGGGALLRMDQLSVTAPNVLSHSSQNQSGSIAELLVNGGSYSAAQASPCFTVAGNAWTWIASNCFALVTTDDVVAIYSY